MHQIVSVSPVAVYLEGFKLKLPKEPVRTRFAPSPTGYLHLGSLRTALFNYLLAKATGGQFLLRIEDTDQRRTVPDAEERLCLDLKWAGIQWDEGPQVGGPYGPYKQSERTALYNEHAHKLLHSKHAYRCFCSSERLDSLAKQRHKLGLPTDYDRTCAGIPAAESEDRANRGESHVVRLRVPSRYPAFNDLVYGDVGREKSGKMLFKHGMPAYEDPVLLKSDGLPTYHLANVVDDHYMKITHVIRAAEWISSTPKHLIMYEAFGWQPPIFAHVGLLQDKKGQKLSKRNFDLDISAFRQDLNIFPEALTNFVALLGWSHDDKNDIMNMQELIEKFDLRFTRGNTIVTFEKLWFLQKAHAQRYAEQGGAEFAQMVDSIAKLVEGHLPVDRREIFLHGRDLNLYIAAITKADAKSYTTAEEFYRRNIYFFAPVINSFYSIVDKNGQPVHEIPIHNLINAAQNLMATSSENWTAETLKERISEVIATMSGTKDLEKIEAWKEQAPLMKKQKAWNKAFHHYLRWALVEGKPGPSISDTMAILGRDVSAERLTQAAALAGGRSRSEGKNSMESASS
ncbi:MAG: Glutamate--tRNA ligase mitochondrial [Pycnora praestabilis]|nr:MAG: Glutamate--tRNA ligase mitochondrial [Pycnora praestabilis]